MFSKQKTREKKEKRKMSVPPVWGFEVLGSVFPLDFFLSFFFLLLELLHGPPASVSPPADCTDQTLPVWTLIKKSGFLEGMLLLNSCRLW